MQLILPSFYGTVQTSAQKKTQHKITKLNMTKSHEIEML